MADFASALRTRLVGATDVGVKVHWGIVPENTKLPYIRLVTISDPRPQHLKGYDGARTTRVRCDCMASTYTQARSIAEQVIAALALPGEYGGIHFGRVKAEGPRDLGEDTEGGYVHRAQLDLLAEHRS